MTALPPDQSRDRRIEDPTNLWVIHPAARRLLPWFVARGISANMVSVGGLALGMLAAFAYAHWTSGLYALAGLLLSICWLIADGLDGMVARATGTASALGRTLDGVCDHGVFVLIYVVLAISLGNTVEAWSLALAAGAAHALQSNLYEGERARFHRRCKGVAGSTRVPAGNALLRSYDHVAGTLERFSQPFDRALRHTDTPLELAQAYGARATGPMRLMSLLSANVRVYAIFLACLFGDPRLFWWFELVPLTGVLIVGLTWHRAVEASLRDAIAAETNRSQTGQSSHQRT